MARGFSQMNHILQAGLLDSRPLIIATRRSNYSHFTILGTNKKLSTIHATVVVNKVIINVDSECLLVSQVGWLASHVKAIV